MCVIVIKVSDSHRVLVEQRGPTIRIKFYLFFVNNFWILSCVSCHWIYITMKYVYDNEILIFEFYICTMFSMSRFWVLCHHPPALSPFVLCHNFICNVNGLAFPGSLDEAMMSEARWLESKSVRETSAPRLGSPKSVRHSGWWLRF